MRRLRFKHKPYIRMAGGPENRINLLRAFITALVKYERIELGYAKAFETQKYAERLIHIAKRGDRDPEAMKIADFWVKDKKQLHKLFKVLGPRFQDFRQNFTRLLRVPGSPEENKMEMAFLEYIGNPYPPLTNEPKRNPNWLVNVLVRGAVADLQGSKTLEGIDTSHVRRTPLVDQVATSDKQYHDNLDGMLHSVDLLSLRTMTAGGVEKRTLISTKETEAAPIDEGTPV